MEAGYQIEHYQEDRSLDNDYDMALQVNYPSNNKISFYYSSIDFESRWTEAKEGNYLAAIWKLKLKPHVKIS